MNIVYTSQQCAYCSQLKKFLTLKGIQYTEKSTDDPKVAQEAMSKFGVLTTPLSIINDMPIVGYKPAEVMKAINA